MQTLYGPNCCPWIHAPLHCINGINSARSASRKLLRNGKVSSVPVPPTNVNAAAFYPIANVVDGLDRNRTRERIPKWDLAPLKIDFKSTPVTRHINNCECLFESPTWLDLSIPNGYFDPRKWFEGEEWRDIDRLRRMTWKRAPWLHAQSHRQCKSPS